MARMLTLFIIDKKFITKFVETITYFIIIGRNYKYIKTEQIKMYHKKL